MRVNLAMKYGVRVIPLLFEDCVGLPDTIRPLVYVDLREPEEVAAGYEVLVRFLRNLTPPGGGQTIEDYEHR